METPKIQTYFQDQKEPVEKSFEFPLFERSLETETAKKTFLPLRSQNLFQLSEDTCAPLKVLATIPGYILIDNTQDHPFIQKGCKGSGKGGILLIDQKSAHSRILFEKLIESKTGAAIAQQTLLIPYTLNLPPHESGTLQTAIPVLNSMGIQIREFGLHTFLVDSIPFVFGNTNLDVLIKDIINQLQSFQEERCGNDLFRQEQAKLIAQAAARAAISCQQKLSAIEAQSLLEQLISCKQPYICPLGKPVIAQITGDKLAELF